MAAIIKIDQAALPAGDNNRSRSDIVAGIAVVVTNVSPGAANTLELLWKPPEDDSSVITGSSPTWSITPKTGTSGKWRLRLTVDSVPMEKTFAVRTPGKSLVIPAANERADPSSDLTTIDPDKIDASDTNEPYTPFTTGSPFGAWKDQEEIIRAIDAVSDSTPTIDNKNMAALVTTGDGDQACNVAIQKTPSADGYVRVMVNGQAVVLGDGSKTEDCYFSGDAGATARAIADIVSGDVLYWNGSIVGFQLAVADRLAFDYNEAN